MNMLPGIPTIDTPADLAQDCDGPDIVAIGDNIPEALLSCTAKLNDCRSRHSKLSAIKTE